MIKKFKLMLYIISLLSLLFILSCNTTQLTKYQDEDTINLQGKLSLVGNYPFETIALKLQNKYQVKLIFKTNKDVSTIKKHIGKTVAVKGKLNIKKLLTADNKNEIIQYQVIVDKIKLKQLF